jgi:light-regulated signal transduction histidine kinase (bacteriophytochrome)
LLTRVRPSSDISPQARKNFLENELSFIDEVKRLSVTVAEEQNKKLVDAHQRFSSLVSTRKFQVVYPVLPMDILGIYVLLPEVAQ